jgi:capsular exopolysaccharide synthesis family protein
MTFARQGAKVLLVDADLHRPKLHPMLGLSGDIGLSNMILAGDANAPLYQSHPQLANLSILTAGLKAPNPAELLSSRRFPELVSCWREKFDYVFIDTPPVLAVSDPLIVSQFVDATIFVVRYKQTTKQSLVRARDVLLRANVKIAGLVVNRMNMDSSDHYYSYGYYGSQQKGYYQ